MHEDVWPHITPRTLVQWRNTATAVGLVFCALNAEHQHSCLVWSIVKVGTCSATRSHDVLVICICTAERCLVLLLIVSVSATPFLMARSASTGQSMKSAGLGAVYQST